jgi:hypothetical protein
MILEPERELIAALFRGLQGTILEGQLILGGSSGLFAFPTSAPAFTEDLDFLVLEDLVASRGAEIVEALATLGYTRTPETPTFTFTGRPGFDLAKDKLQALLVVSEHAADNSFREVLPRIFSRFDPERSKDALADAHLAFLSLQREPGFQDHGAEGYAAFLERVESGYEALASILGGRRRG